VPKKAVCLATLIAIILVLLYGCGRYNRVSSTSTDVEKSIDTKRNPPVTELSIPDKDNILQEVVADIDSDNIKENIILDSRPSDYIRLLIYRNADCIFNSCDYGIEMQKDFLEFNDGDFVTVSDSNKNGISEIYFIVCDDGIQPNGLAIIENYKVLFFKPLTNFEYVDLSSDGSLELCGCSNWGGQVMFNAAEYSTFQNVDGQYEDSTELTKVYYQKLCSQAEDEFIKEENYDNLEYLISLYAKTGDREKGELLINKYINLLNGGDDQYDADFFAGSFEQRLAENGY
jgi:hypothetical protein